VSFDTATPYIASYVIMRKGNKIAFVLRSKTNWMNNYYGLPSGKVEKQENYKRAAIREAKEEVGIDINPKDLKFVHVMHRNEGHEWVDIFFEAAKWQGEPYNAEPHMHSEFLWLDLKKLPKNTIPSVAFALGKISKGELYSEYGWKAKQ
jgi:8-oxo-dGTP diphosphatase